MDYSPSKDSGGPVFGEVMRANCQVLARAHKAAGQEGMQPGHLLRAYGSKAGLEHQTSAATPLEAQMQKRKAVKLLRRVMHILAQAKQDAVPLGVKRSAADSLHPEHAQKRLMLLRPSSAPLPHLAAAQQPQHMDWAPQSAAPEPVMQHGLAGPVSVWLPSTGGVRSAACPSFNASPLPNPFTVTTPPLPPPREQLLPPAPSATQQQFLQAMRMEVCLQQQEGPSVQPPAAALHRANSVPPAAELSWQEASAPGSMFKAKSMPLPESRMRINRRNIVQRLAELGTPAAQPAVHAAAGVAAQQPQQPPPASLLLERRECGAYARRIGRFLGCGEGVEECAADRPAHLVAKAALRRYLDGQVAVGASKDAVWSDLNGEVGDVLLKRLAARSAALASRRQSPLSQGR